MNANVQLLKTTFFNFEVALEVFCSNPLFDDIEEWSVENNPYKRPIGCNDLKSINFLTPLTQDNYLSRSSLVCHRILCNIYHNDFVFLPTLSDSNFKKNLDLFYSDTTKISGQIIRPILEHYLFDFLEDEIDVTGKWTEEALASYFLSLPKRQENSESALVRAILDSVNPVRATHNLLIQFAIDFLSEASGIARKVMGNFGKVQSELFKIFIDEYGYGVHETKHSTLYEKLLRAHNLSDQPHTYWQYYLTSSFAVPNYFQYIALNHRRFFHYVGAVYYAETSYYHTCQQFSKMLVRIFGSKTETRYFDEHFHIDQHHSRMTYEKLIRPLVSKFGESIIGDIVRGYEEFRLITELSEKDFLEQLSFIDSLESYKKSEDETLKIVATQEFLSKCQEFTKSKDKRVTSASDDYDLLYVVESGTLEIALGHNCKVSVHPGESLFIPKNRLYVTGAEEGNCVYKIYQFKDAVHSRDNSNHDRRKL